MTIAMMTLLPFVPASKLLAVMPVVLRLHSPGRRDYADWLINFERAVMRFVTVDDLCTAARGLNMQAARAAVHLLDQHHLLEPPALLALILERNDDIVLAQRALLLCAELPPAQQAACYQAAAQSHFGPVRIVAIRALLAMDSESVKEFAVAALLDVQASVREVAANYLLARGFDVRSHYRSLLRQDMQAVRRTRICLIALAALRDVADVELVRLFQSSAYSSNSSRAIRNA